MSDRPLCGSCFKSMSRQLDGHGWICLPCGKKYDSIEAADKDNPLGQVLKGFGLGG